MHMKQVLSLILPFALLFLGACDEDVTSTKSDENGYITLVVDSKEQAQKGAPDSTGSYSSTSSVSELEVRVLTGDDAVIATETFTPVDGLFDVTMEVSARESLQVLCLGFSGGEVAYFGIDADVDVQKGETTTAYITGWDNPYVTELIDVSPNTSITGDFQVSWTQAPNATMYILQEATGPLFEGATALYSGTNLQFTVFGNATGHYYLRVQASNRYGIASAWSNIDSVTVDRNLPVISGTITGADSVLVTLSGDSSDTLTVNDGETYSFTVNRGGTYTVTPSKEGCTFNPESITYSAISTSQTKDFIEANVLITYDISGTLSGTGAEDVMLILGGDALGSVNLDDGGSYLFEVIAGGNYTVTPKPKNGYVFYPETMAFNYITSDQTQDFTVEVNKFSISGKIIGATGVDVKITGHKAETDVVGASGTYSFLVNKGGDYTITPSKPGYEFSPASQTFTNLTSNKTVDFKAISLPQYTISGTVYGANGVTLILNGDVNAGAEVNHGGTYKFTVPEGGDYTITAYKEGYALSPESITFNNITADQTQDFIASKGIYTISGIIKYVDGVTVTLSGNDSKSMIVNAGEMYSFSVAGGGTYTVTPSKQGYKFTPPSRTFESIDSNKPYINFLGENIDGDPGGDIIDPSPDFEPIQMVYLQTDSYQMGDLQNSGGDNERPVHTVSFSSFEIGKSEVTQAQYASITGSNPSKDYGNGDNYPVYNVTWFNAVKFCNMLSDADGYQRCYNENTWECDFSKDGYRLPTEAEWEYACRAGTETQYYYPLLEDAGWYILNSGNKTSQIAQLGPNKFGLYDMHGNVAEWCNDWYDSDYYTVSPENNPVGPVTGTERIIRGGAFSSWHTDCRSSSRNKLIPSLSVTYVGFRVVRSPHDE